MKALEVFDGLIETTMLVIKPTPAKGGASGSVSHLRLPPKPGFELLNSLIIPHLRPDGRPEEERYTLEHVGVLYGGSPRDMFVDDDGLRKGLAVNQTATDIYRASYVKRFPKTNPDKMPFIVGNAVLFTNRRVWF